MSAPPARRRDKPALKSIPPASFSPFWPTGHGRWHGPLRSEVVVISSSRMKSGSVAASRAPHRWRIASRASDGIEAHDGLLTRRNATLVIDHQQQASRSTWAAWPQIRGARNVLQMDVCQTSSSVQFRQREHPKYSLAARPCGWYTAATVPVAGAWGPSGWIGGAETEITSLRGLFFPRLAAHRRATSNPWIPAPLQPLGLHMFRWISRARWELSRAPSHPEFWWMKACMPDSAAALSRSAVHVAEFPVVSTAGAEGRC